MNLTAMLPLSLEGSDNFVLRMVCSLGKKLFIIVCLLLLSCRASETRPGIQSFSGFLLRRERHHLQMGK